MDKVIEALNNGRIIEAIKAFRLAYGTSLVDAKNACEALRKAYVPHTIPTPPWPAPPAKPEFYAVISRYHEHDYDHVLTNCSSKNEAECFAREIVDNRDEVMIVKIIAQSTTVTTRSMKEV